jgi:hypothetical protein
MIYSDSNVLPLLTEDYMKLRRVLPILASPQLQDCLAKKQSSHGEKESEKQKPTESQPEQPIEEPKFIPTVNHISTMNLLRQIYFMEKCGKRYSQNLKKLTMYTV